MGIVILKDKTKTGLPTAHFELWEFANWMDKKTPGALLLSERAKKFFDMLEELRVWYGKPMNVTSGYRTPEYNASKEVGGAKDSYHLESTAADIALPKGGLTAGQIGDFIRRWRQICLSHGETGGMEIASGHLHFDIGKRRDRFYVMIPKGGKAGLFYIPADLEGLVTWFWI